MRAMTKIDKHRRNIERLARLLPAAEVFRWLLEKGFYPEAYVLPPCFCVAEVPQYIAGSRQHKSGGPPWREPSVIGFPKTSYTDRRFSIVDGDIYYDVAAEFADHWSFVCDALFDERNLIASYSFPLPVTTNSEGTLSGPRSGRMIYEWIEMAENDLIVEAHDYTHIGRTDIKNFYHSVYTHSIAWALHGKNTIRMPGNRVSTGFLGNRLDKLFQAMNDGRTNGIPIGPAVSDLVAEVVLTAVGVRCSDRLREQGLADEVLLVRFKDDYRILARNTIDGQSAVRALQASLAEYNLELHDGKTEFSRLPQGLFRPWKSRYHSANPDPTKVYDFNRFREVYLSVTEIERELPGTGVIDRFLSDLVEKPGYTLRFSLRAHEVERAVSLLLMLAEHRSKSFPMVLGVLGELGRGSSKETRRVREVIESILRKRLATLIEDEESNAYQLVWLVYFLRAYGDRRSRLPRAVWKNDLVQAVAAGRRRNPRCPGFRTFQGVAKSSSRLPLLHHLDVFRHDE